MDWTTIISAAVAAISAGGGIGIFFDRKHKKRAAELANESTVSSQWKELYERSEAKVNSQSDKIEGLYKTIGDLRSQVNGLTSQRAVLTLYKCCKVNCPDREPPLDHKKTTPKTTNNMSKEQIEFVKKVYPAAARLAEAGGVNPLFVTAQAALETGWKIRGIGNNIFGITKGSWTGPVSLELTTEYFKTPTVTFKAPERVVSVDQVAPDRYKYRVYRLFRVYPTVDACLDDHLALLKKPMYADAWPYRNDAKEYARRLVDNTGAKYATAPNYAAIMASVIDTVANIVKSL